MTDLISSTPMCETTAMSATTTSELLKMPLHTSKEVITEYPVPFSEPYSIRLVVTRVVGGWLYFYRLSNVVVFVPISHPNPQLV